MCLAVPGKIVSVNETDPLFRLGVVDFGGVTREVNLACVPEAVPGDYVIVHVGMALSVLDEGPALQTARKLNEELRHAVTRPWAVMEVCGGQTHAIASLGLEELLPPGLRLIHGPGCPVCVTAVELFDQAVE